MDAWDGPGRAAAGAALLVFLGGVASAQQVPSTSDLATELNALKIRIAELEAQQSQNWMTTERETQIRDLVNDVIEDARSRGQLDGGVETGYSSSSGFFIQTPDKNYKLSIGGLVQIRYEAAISNATNGRTFPNRTVGSGTVVPEDPGNSNGFDIRRARVSFAGNIFSPNLTYKLEGDFYGSSTGAFTVTDAWIGYKFTDLLRVRVGGYKVPFAREELASDPGLSFMERAEVLAPFNPQRSIGVSLFGDIVKDQLAYELSVNNGGNSNTLRRNDTVGLSANLDNRLGFYGRMQWAGIGKLSDFGDTPDLRKENGDFVWMLGAAVGYESQTADNSAFPSPQTTAKTNGLSTGTGFTNYTLNGDILRGTVDWAAKYQGFSLVAAGYFQQVNANPGNTSSSSPTTITTGPYGASNSSFFQWGGHGQIGYFVIPQRLELVGRAGLLATEGGPNVGEFYSVGANYYVYGHNLKIMSDITYTPESPYTDAAASLLQNTHDLIFRVQLQLKF